MNNSGKFNEISSTSFYCMVVCMFLTSLNLFELEMQHLSTLCVTAFNICVCIYKMEKCCIFNSYIYISISVCVCVCVCVCMCVCVCFCIIDIDIDALYDI